MLCCLVSDTHLRHVNTPRADVLIHAGDATLDGSIEQVAAFANWFMVQPARRRVFVPGNHDWLFERNYPLAFSMLAERGIVTLLDTALEFEGMSFYGTPWQPEFMNWAFNKSRGRALAEKWARIPDKLDVLITHGPPLGIGDEVARHQSLSSFGPPDDDEPRGEHVGCADLYLRVMKVKPQLHVYGHVHGGYGLRELHGIKFANASICDEGYRPMHKPILIELEPRA